MIDFVKISDNWNADPVLPEISLKAVGVDLEMVIFLNYFAFDNYSEGDKARITFINCSKYSLNTCNDEGYHLGQYRITPTELPWGEFYEITSGVNKDFAEPILELSDEHQGKRHFLFFFKDETFECLADDYKIEFIYNDRN
jgi:hypothetical protein